MLKMITKKELIKTLKFKGIEAIQALKERVSVDSIPSKDKIKVELGKMFSKTSGTDKAAKEIKSAILRKYFNHINARDAIKEIF